jgi:hypothetical protein
MVSAHSTNFANFLIFRAELATSRRHRVAGLTAKMMGFTRGGVQDGTIGSAGTAEHAPVQPRPAGIPAHYIFDEEVELWMPPSAIAKSAKASGSWGGPASDITVIRSSDVTPSPYQAASSSDPICFEYTNTGVCGRLNRGEVCRYRHLEPNHPDVLADKVRTGKLPASSLGEMHGSNIQVRRARHLARLTSCALPANEPRA